MRPHLELSDVPQDHISMHKLGGSQKEYSFKLTSTSRLPLYKRFLLCFGLDRLAGVGMGLSVSSTDEMAVLTDYSDSEV